MEVRHRQSGRSRTHHPHLTDTTFTRRASVPPGAGGCGVRAPMSASMSAIRKAPTNRNWPVRTQSEAQVGARWAARHEDRVGSDLCLSVPSQSSAWAAASASNPVHSPSWSKTSRAWTSTGPIRSASPCQYGFRAMPFAGITHTQGRHRPKCAEMDGIERWGHSSAMIGRRRE